MNTAQRRPVAVLVLPAQPALEVDAPGLHLVRPELQRLERNLDLGVPPVFTDARADVPDAVPVGVGVAAFVRHLRVPLRAHRVDRELIAVALIVEGVDHDLEAVGVAGVEVLPQLVDDDLGRRRILREHADVEGVVVVEQPDLGFKGRLVEFSVERDRPLRLRRHQPALLAGRVVIDAAVLRGLCGCIDRDRQQGRSQHS